MPAEPLTAGRRPVRWAGEYAALATALQPALAARGGCWIGWHGSDSNAMPIDRLQAVALYPVPLSELDIADHLEGQCASTIAPLFHDGAERAVFHRRWRRAYRAVNERYAKAAAAAAAPEGQVWVFGHDLQLTPALLRAMRPDLTVGFYLPLPVPPPELFRRLPMRRELIAGMLGADVVVLPDLRSAENFRRLASDIGDWSADGIAGEQRRGPTAVQVLPMGADAQRVAHLAAGANIGRRVDALRRELRTPRVVLLAIDALDANSGAEQRLAAYGELLADRTIRAEDCTLVQIVQPQIRPTPDQERLRGRIEQLVARINGSHSAVGRPAVQYMHRALDPIDVVALFRLADVLLATALRDGTNLIAKEYVAARADGTGMLVLSEFSGTAEELTQAYLVNPYDVEDLKRAIVAGIEPGPDTPAAMRQMRAAVLRQDVRWWAATALGLLHSSTEIPRPRIAADHHA
ncbi:trehalose-6-phosphate synthase [Dactylosporangium matsuzakiense]|uniref:Trehalose-6-phosphate synthase n=1 Tax=Dactylosporangium matsuzakiense TaxID=53360 RepID=A0A9W6NK93_9ACTN|nr:trehalose-6-phosphate synthase [Dactylosporangium matsuzakiense]